MRFFISFLLIAVSVLNTSCALCEGDFDWKNIYSFNFENIKFGETSYREIARKCPDFKLQKVSDIYILEVDNPQKKFAAIRIGFDSKKTVEWIEFILKGKQPLDNFLSIYDTPHEVDSTYDKNFDYYDYKDFKLCTDKTAQNVYSITFYNVPEIPESVKNIGKIFPPINALNSSNQLQPGKTVENEFTNAFPNIIAEEITQTKRSYSIGAPLIHSYKKAELVFDDGILSFINLVPQKMTIDTIKKIYGNSEKIGKEKGLTFYEYSNFIVTTDKKNNIISIGVFSSSKNYATNK